MLAFADSWKLIFTRDDVWERYRATITKVEAEDIAYTVQIILIMIKLLIKLFTSILFHFI